MTTTTIAHNDKTDQHAYDAALAITGRTFHWARRFLGKTHGNHGARLYAFCRLLDDLADGDLPHGKARLAAIAADLDTLLVASNKALCDPDMAEFAPFMQRQQIPAEALRHLIDGLLFDQGPVAVNTQEALITYGYQVAGTVGLMMCPILDCHDTKAKQFAIDMGIAMQLTNIARDVLEDAQMGRRYLPGQWCDGVSPQEIATAARTNDAEVIMLIQSAIERLLQLADRYYHSGFQGLCYLPKRAQIAIAVAAYAYRQIGYELRKNHLNWHQGRTVTSTTTKARVSIKALRFFLPQRHPDRHDHTLHKALEGYAK